MRIDLAKLNPPQRQAVKTIEGPLLVLAGAGSGKTRVIVHRIGYMIQQGIRPESILAVTFTNKAASEMRERVAALVGPAHAKLLTVCTFHAFGCELLRRHIHDLGYPKRFAIADASDQLAFVKRAMKDVRIDDRRYDARKVQACISKAKCANRVPEVKPAEAGDDFDLVTALVYPRYELGLRAQGSVDFDDLILLPIRLMKELPDAREQILGRYRYLLVDEYQDTNHAQLELLTLLAGESRNVCAVGDDDQSIYSWRGAEVANILQFDRHFPGAKEVRLEQNYRSTGAVLDAANAVIAKNEARKPKKLWTAAGPGDPVKVVVCPNDDEEGRWVASEVKQLVGSGRKPGEIAVLYRTNQQARPLEEALRAEQIPYEVVGGQEFFDRKEIKDLVAYLRACEFEGDELSLLRIVNVPARGIGDATMTRLSAHARRLRIPIEEAIRRSGEFDDLPAGASDRLKDFSSMLQRYRRRFQAEPIGPVTRELVAEIGLKEEARKAVQSADAGARRAAAIEDFVNSMQAWSEREREPSLEGWLRRIALDTREEESGPPQASVSLMTLHGAKGLEWPFVFLCGLEEDLLPHGGMQGEEQNLDEERRLAYVGITRARERLYLTRAAQRVKRGKLLPRTPSRFLDDIPKEALDLVDTTLSAAAAAEEKTKPIFSSFLAQMRAKSAGQAPKPG